MSQVRHWHNGRSNRRGLHHLHSIAILRSVQTRLYICVKRKNTHDLVISDSWKNSPDWYNWRCARHLCVILVERGAFRLPPFRGLALSFLHVNFESDNLKTVFKKFQKVKTFCDWSEYQAACGVTTRFGASRKGDVPKSKGSLLSTSTAAALTWPVWKTQFSIQ